MLLKDPRGSLPEIGGEPCVIYATLFVEPVEQFHDGME
jgi:hypothetical protein